MKSFKPSLWDDTDPLYAPCMSQSKNRYYWKAPKKYLDMGYTHKRQALDGKAGDGMDEARAATCRALTRKMLTHFRADTPDLIAGTWEWLFRTYQRDIESPYREVKANTQISYDSLIETWISAIGGSRIADANYRAFRRWERAMIDNGRSKNWIHRMFTMMRIVVRYGCAIEDKECQRFVQVLSNVRIPKGSPKTSSATPEQIAAIVASAQAEGNHAFALGCAMQWWFSLRAVDVRGHWLKIRDGEEPVGIVRNGKRWQDGLTWDMIDRGVTVLTKTFSKTRGSTGETRSFDLTQVPEIRHRLLTTPPEKRVGPVIISEKNGMPYTQSGWAQLWRRHREAAGVPDHVQNMDVRSTALTHGKNAGATPFDLRDAAGHSNINTTNIYIRGKDAAVSKVIDLRRGGRK